VKSLLRKAGETRPEGGRGKRKAGKKTPEVTRPGRTGEEWRRRKKTKIMRL